MPANLTPQYIEAERKFRAAKTAQEKIKCLEEMIATIPKHKGTEKMQAMLKTKMAKLRAALESRPGATRHGPGFHVEKSGAGQVIVIGPPNSGKSCLIAALTGAQPEVADYPYTTRFPAPYMMKHENVRVQLVDTPPLSPDDINAELVELAKTADCIMLVLDLANRDAASALEALLSGLQGKRLELAPENASPFQEPGRFVKKTLVVGNKSDLPAAEENAAFLREYFADKISFVVASAVRGDGVDALRTRVFLLLDVIRVYSKIPGKKADLSDPFVLKKASTVMEMARTVHKDFVEKFRYARVWRKGALQGQMVNRDFVLEDEDIVELHI
ncbi:MAG: 50S ribosome-binding GTPase [Clostridiales bacterium]|nr:50S ribosome-binding GTPase [Clostridiales bacterium]